MEPLDSPTQEAYVVREDGQWKSAFSLAAADRLRKLGWQALAFLQNKDQCGPASGWIGHEKRSTSVKAMILFPASPSRTSGPKDRRR